MDGRTTPREFSAWVQYGVAAAAMAAGVAVRLSLSPALGNKAPLMLLILPVVIAAWFGGMGPGLLATALGLLAGSYLLLEPRYSLDVADAADQARLGLFLLIGVCISLLSERMHQARRRAQAGGEALDQARCRTARILAGITDGYFAVDEQWRIIAANQRAAEYCAVPRHEMLGRNIWQLWPQGLGTVIEHEYARAMSQQEPVHFEACFDPACDRWIEVHAYPTPRDLSVFFRDITSRKRAEQRLRDSEDRLRLATEAGQIGVWEWDLTCNRVSWTVQCSALLGLSETAQPACQTLLEALHPEDRQRVHEQLHGATGDRRDFSIECRALWGDDSTHWLLIRGRTLDGPQGQPARMHGVVIDISQRKGEEQQLVRDKEAAEGANRAKDQFLATLSHELRTPLTPVLMTAESLAANMDLPAMVRGDLEMIGQNVAMEARLIDDLLDLTRIDHGKLRLSREETDVHEAIRKACDTCRRGEVAGRLPAVQLRLDATRHWVMGDPARLQQIFWNLLRNAIKFTPANGRITVRTWDDGEGRLAAEVADTGAGIEAQFLPRLFNPFEQGGGDVPERFGGLGLGLAICKALAELHGGTIEAHSEGKDRGASFIVQLPVIAAPASPEPQPAPPVASLPAGRPLRILLVEDHASTAKVLERLLRSFDHEVKTAGTVAQALALEQEDGLDLIIADLGLPDGSGLDLMHQIKQRRDITGIALSGYGTAEDVRKSHEAGFSEHLVKPVSIHILEQAIARMAEQAAKPAHEDGAARQVVRDQQT